MTTLATLRPRVCTERGFSTGMSRKRRISKRIRALSEAGARSTREYTTPCVFLKKSLPMGQSRQAMPQPWRGRRELGLTHYSELGKDWVFVSSASAGEGVPGDYHSSIDLTFENRRFSKVRGDR